jgi:hypothetical protein
MSESKTKTGQAIIDKINSFNLETPRLHLTKFSEKDIEMNLAHEMNPEIMRFIRDPMSHEDTLKKSIKTAQDYSGFESDWVLFATRLKTQHHPTSCAN